MIIFLTMLLLLAGPTLAVMLGALWIDYRRHQRAAFDAHADQATALTHPARRPRGPEDDPTAMRRVAIRAHLLATLPQPCDLCPHCGQLVIDPLTHHHLYHGRTD
ncbi:MAG: hypothetical protein WCF04_02235 [Candidatus Nanopelagicales bacterium]